MLGQLPLSHSSRSQAQLMNYIYVKDIKDCLLNVCLV